MADQFIRLSARLQMKIEKLDNREKSNLNYKSLVFFLEAIWRISVQDIPQSWDVFISLD